MRLCYLGPNLLIGSVDIQIDITSAVGFANSVDSERDCMQRLITPLGKFVF